MSNDTFYCNLLQNKDSKQREFGLDVLRAVGLLLVIGVHFFSYTNFYSIKLTTVPMIFTAAFRQLFSACIPIFLLLSGYLLNKAKVCKKYYFRCIRIIFEYVVVSIICYLVRVYYFKQEIAHPIADLFSFGLAGYSWYVNMYLGLFLLIPFINILYKSIPTKSQKLILIGSLIFINSIIGLINSFKFAYATNYWAALYPIMYYLIGNYICEYKPKVNRLALLFIIILTAMLATSFIFINNEEKIFNYRLSWYEEIFTVTISTCIFLMLYRIKAPKFEPISWFFSTVSKSSLSAFMLSQLVDIAFYKILNQKKTDFISKLEYMPIMVLTIFCISVVAGYAVFLLYDVPSKLIRNKLQALKDKQNKSTTKEVNT